MLVFLLVIFLAIQIVICVIARMMNLDLFVGKLRLKVSELCVSGLQGKVPVEYVFSGSYMCINSLLGDFVWIFGLAWETLALCLAIWIAIRHFRELQRPSSGWAVGDCFTVLIETHVFYFAR
jgi:hypothetical protein